MDFAVTSPDCLRSNTIMQLEFVWPCISFEYGSEYQDKSAIFSDISIPATLTDVEVYYYSNCTQVMTAFKSVFIAGVEFTADPTIFTFVNPESPLFITYHYPEVTLTSLTVGQTLTFVR